MYHQSVVLKLLAILFHYWHIFILFGKFALSAVRNDKFPTAEEPMKLLDFTLPTARKNSYIINKIITWLFSRAVRSVKSSNLIGPWVQTSHSVNISSNYSPINALAFSAVSKRKIDIFKRYLPVTETSPPNIPVTNTLMSSFFLKAK